MMAHTPLLPVGRPSLSLTRVSAATYLREFPSSLITLTVASLYDFATSGLGTYSFTPITTFQVAGAEEKEVVASKLSKVQVSTNQIDVEITGDVAKRAHSVNKRATDICTTSSKKTFIDAR